MSLKQDLNEYIPQFFRCTSSLDEAALQNLVAQNKRLEIHDTIYYQLRELIKGRNASAKLSENEYTEQIAAHLDGCDLACYGVWVFYPWSHRLVHLLDEQEFAEVRMQRNRYKITEEEQQLLASKIVGIVGLSVGQSVALTMAMERGFGELRLADFDSLELSNLNRIRTGVHHLGLSKVIIAAREIAEIDPYLRVTCFREGLSDDNLHSFFTAGGQLDLLVEECDSLDIKLLARLKARELGVPVLMETNDRCMLDVERFDYEAERPILHGLVGDLQSSELKNLSNECKVDILFQLLGIDQISTRGIASMLEVGHTIGSWSQLASSVTFGGALVADVSRRILLGEKILSGRTYVDLDEIVRAGPEDFHEQNTHENPYKPLEKEEVIDMVIQGSKYLQMAADAKSLTENEIRSLVKAGMDAPSTGNNQPWKWFYADNVLYLFHDRFRSFNFANFSNTSAFLSLGAAVENVIIQAEKLMLWADYQLHYKPDNQALVATFTFSSQQSEAESAQKNRILADHIATRCTNRNVSDYRPLAHEAGTQLRNEARKIAFADVKWLTEQPAIAQAAQLIAQCDRIHFLHENCHHDLFKRELRWDNESEEVFKDGIPVSTIGFSVAQLGMLRAIERPEVVEFIRKIRGGKAFEKITFDSLSSASAIGLVTMEDGAADPYLTGGRAMQRLWLEADRQNLSIQPFMAPIFFIPRILSGDVSGFSKQDVEEIKHIGKCLAQIFELPPTHTPVFLFKLFYSDQKVAKAPRLDLEDVLFKS